MKIQISDNIIKYYLRNVYFINGHAYAGKRIVMELIHISKRIYGIPKFSFCERLIARYTGSYSIVRHSFGAFSGSSAATISLLFLRLKPAAVRKI